VCAVAAQVLGLPERKLSTMVEIKKVRRAPPAVRLLHHSGAPQ
jgi:hypothetical protein